MDASTEQVEQLIHDIRRRWRRRSLIQGTAITAIILLLLATGMLVGYIQFDVPSAVQIAALAAGAVLVIGTGVQFILRPLMRRITDRQIALYVEEKIPELEDRLNSVVEISDSGGLSYEDSVLIDRLIDDAARKTEEIPITTVVERGKEWMLAYGAAGVMGLFLLIGFLSLDDLRQAISDVQQLPTTLTEAPINVRPGNLEVEQGDSQEIIATIRSETDEDVMLHFKRGSGQWEQTIMRKGLNEPAYLHEFRDVQEPIQYTVETGDKRAGPFTLSLYEFPEVQQIDLTYDYPAYSGQPVRTEENMGDIRGLEGSTVTVSITTRGDVAEAVMARETGSDIRLERVSDNRFEGRFTLEEKDFYTLRLTDERDKQNKFPQEYRIQPVSDEKPRISISDPGRDLRANAIQEVLVAADVRDDYGVENVRLNYSVNGDEEQTVALADPSSLGGREVSGEHLFFLEEYSLEPGDVISYYVQADDNNGQNSPEVTDMYFIEVMPFDQRFSQVNNAGGAQGGGQPSGTVLSQQQIITATWKLFRQKDEMSSDEFQSSLDALVQGQNNLRQNIEQRINSTAFSTELQSSEKHQQIADALRNAVQEMKTAEDELSSGELKGALTPERKALNHLLKAEASNKEQRIALQRGQQSSGGGSAATEERMSELMDLELDISKDKYEMQQQSTGSRQQQTSEALDRIKELAQKQEQLLEQKELDTQGEDKKRFIDRLEREQQQLRRQTEDLAQQMRKQSQRRGQQSEQMNQELDRITEQMKEAGRSLREQDVQKARSQQQQALSDLQRMQRKLQMDNTDNLREQLDQFTQRFDQLDRQQEELSRDIRETASEAQENNGRIDQEQLQELTEQQQTLSDEAGQLREEADRLREQSQSSNRELASKLENLEQRMEEMNLEQQMNDSEQALEQGWLDYAQRKQSDIERSMEQLSSDMRAFDEELPQTEEEQLARSLEDVRDLMDQMQELQKQSQALQRAQNQQGQTQQQQSGGQQSQDRPSQNQQARGQSSQGQQSQSQRAQAQSRRLQQQLQRAQQSVDELRQQLEGNPQAQQQLNQLDSYLKNARADHTGVLLDEEAAEKFFNEDIYSPLSELELALARELDTVEMEKKLYGARRGEVPEEYQQLVEKYYEQLSKSDQ